MRPNVLLITADDLNYESLGVTGCPVDNISPNIDRLASEGMRFENAHVAIAICCPSRQAMMSGRYPHRSGGLGDWGKTIERNTLNTLRKKDPVFNEMQVHDWAPVAEDVPVLQEQLYQAGYINGIIGKASHLKPQHKYHWDTYIHLKDEEGYWGRDPKRYYRDSKEFIEKAKAQNKPFFLMANSHDPHRPFAGSQKEYDKFGCYTQLSRQYKPEEVNVFEFLPDIPDVRLEISQYYSSVHRCDETVGEILRALDESGLADNTLVMFLSDNGASFPFSKTNCYLNSTKTPWIVRWPGKVKAGTINHDDFICGIDYAATILEAVGLPQMKGMDGQSFLPLLLGQKMEHRDKVVTVLNTTSGKRIYPMRCVQNKKFGYIFNAWSDDETVFKNESQSGLTFNAMKEAAKTDKAIAERVNLFMYRVREEFYDFGKDPDALYNLIDNADYSEQINIMREELMKFMSSTNDPVTGLFKRTVLGR